MLRFTLLFFCLLMLIGCAAQQDAAAPKTAARGGSAGILAVESAGGGSDDFPGDEVQADVSKGPQANFHGAPPPPPPPQLKDPPPNPGPSFVAQNPHVADLIIYTASITMAVYQVEPGLDAVERIAREVNGYLAVRGDNQITIRVPRAQFDEALRRVQLTGDVLHRDVKAEDVTDRYVELETRLRNARAMRDRLQELLARAAVKEAIEIEKELGRVTGDIEAMEGKLKVLKDKIAYSTITVAFSPRGASAVRDVPLRLPFGWLNGLGLPRLLSLGEGQ